MPCLVVLGRERAESFDRRLPECRGAVRGRGSTTERRNEVDRRVDARKRTDLYCLGLLLIGVVALLITTPSR